LEGFDRFFFGGIAGLVAIYTNTEGGEDRLKPDWVENDAKFIWESKEQENLTITPMDDSSITIKAIKPGVTHIQVKEQLSGKTKEMKIRVVEK
jgi:fructan beta-fructosidase